jgi:hypothetical protein
LPSPRQEPFDFAQGRPGGSGAFPRKIEKGKEKMGEKCAPTDHGDAKFEKRNVKNEKQEFEI